jgi:xylan 1,4-beta-xylosidase
LATNGVDKPVLNVFRMAGLMQGDRLTVESSGHIPVETIASQGVRGVATDVDAFATRSAHNVSVMVWNYQDEDVPGDDAQIELRIAGISKTVPRVLIHHYRIDKSHSNAYTVWKDLGSPMAPTAQQYSKLEAAGQLQLMDSPYWHESHDGTAKLRFTLPLQAISLVELSW